MPAESEGDILSRSLFFMESLVDTARSGKVKYP